MSKNQISYDIDKLSKLIEQEEKDNINDTVKKTESRIVKKIKRINIITKSTSLGNFLKNVNIHSFIYIKTDSIIFPNAVSQNNCNIHILLIVF